MKVVTIGRSSQNNDIIINDSLVSRYHVQIVMDDNGNYTIMDLNSTNGTYVNGQRIHGEAVLRPGDEVRVGNTVLPWQSYFTDVCAAVAVEGDKTNRTWMYVAAGLAVLLLLGGAVIWKLYQERPNSGSQPPEVVLRDSLSRRDAQEALANAEANAQYEQSMREYAEDQYNRSEDLRAQEGRQAQEAIGAIQQRMEQQAHMADSTITARDQTIINMESQQRDAQNRINDLGQRYNDLDQRRIGDSIRAADRISDLNERMQEQQNAQLRQMNRAFDQLINSVTRDRILNSICDSCGIPSTNSDAESKRNWIIMHYHQGDFNTKIRVLDKLMEALGQPDDIEELSTSPENGAPTTTPNANGTTPTSPNNNGTNPSPNVQGTTPQSNNGGKTPAPSNNDDDDDFYDDDEDDDDGTSIRI